MKKVRIISRLDVKGENVVKGIQFECLRVMGKPNDMAKEYYDQAADEIIYTDIVANLYQRNNLLEIVDETTDDINIPMTVGGGIRSVSDIKKILFSGADKVTINTAAINNPYLITEGARLFGSQCIVVSIEAKNTGPGKWEAYTDNGRERTGKDVLEWAREAEQLGAGELLLTSVDKDGTETGFDYELLKKVCSNVSIPVIASGGAGSHEDILRCITECKPDGIAVGSILHYRKTGIYEIKEYLHRHGVPVRQLSEAKRANITDHDFVNDYNKYTLQHLENRNKPKRTTNIKQAKSSDYDIGVINYGVNNVKSVVKACETIGKTARIIDTPEEVFQSKCIILPGVGAFSEGMKSLKKSGCADAIIKQVKNGVPLLGICLGMQLLFSKSHEFGEYSGLGIIEGSIRKINPCDERFYVPHVGWNNIEFEHKSLLFKDIDSKDCLYFVHSYCADIGKSYTSGSIRYGKDTFCVALKKDNVCATQFHPEKSGKVGLKILSNFCSIYEV